MKGAQDQPKNLAQNVRAAARGNGEETPLEDITVHFFLNSAEIARENAEVPLTGHVSFAESSESAGAQIVVSKLVITRDR